MCFLLQDAFIVDNNRNGVWLWVGKLASRKERKEGMRRLMVCIPSSDDLKFLIVIDVKHVIFHQEVFIH